MKRYLSISWKCHISFKTDSHLVKTISTVEDYIKQTFVFFILFSVHRKRGESKNMAVESDNRQSESVCNNRTLELKRC